MDSASGLLSSSPRPTSCWDPLSSYIGFFLLDGTSFPSTESPTFADVFSCTLYQTDVRAYSLAGRGTHVHQLSASCSLLS